MEYCLLCNKSDEDVEAIYANRLGRTLCIDCAKGVVAHHTKPYFRPLTEIKDEFDAKFNNIMADLKDEIQNLVFASDFPPTEMARVTAVPSGFLDNYWVQDELWFHDYIKRRNLTFEIEGA